MQIRPRVSSRLPALASARLGVPAALMACVGVAGCIAGLDWTLADRPQQLPGILVTVPAWKRTERRGRPLNGAVLWMAPDRRQTFVSLVWIHGAIARTHAAQRRGLEGDGADLGPTGVPNGELGAFETVHNVPAKVGGHEGRLWRLNSRSEPIYAARIYTWHCPKTHRNFQLRVQAPLDERDELVKASAAIAATLRCHTEDVGHLRFERRTFGGLPEGSRIRKVDATRCVVELPEKGYFSVAWTPSPPTDVAARDEVQRRIRAVAASLKGEGTTVEVVARPLPLRGHEVWLALITAAGRTESTGSVVYALWGCSDTHKVYEIVHPSSPAAGPDREGLETLLKELRCH